MKKKKGFTLVELLAVIVILAVVSIVAIPIIINLIEEAKKGALKDSVEGLTKAADMYYFQNMKNTEEGVQIEIINNEQTAPSSPKLNYKGDVKNGFVLISYDGKVAVCVDDGKYYASRALGVKDIITDNGSCTSEFDQDLQAFVTEGSANYVGLKLNVKAYKDRSSLPSKGSEGSIAIITEDKITGYYASRYTPSEPKDGMVWVVTNNNAEHYIKTKTSEVGISYALQYKDGKWELKDTYAYNDEWIQVKSYKDSEYEWDYDYDGKYKTFTAPYDGYYTVELWGAGGGDHNSVYLGGKGAYTKGDIYLKKDEEIYIYVGGRGGNTGSAGWNGGGTGTAAAGGGGSTDVRTVPTSSETTWNERNSLLSRIMVAGGGGGSTVHSADSWVSYEADAGGLKSYVAKGGSGSNPYTGTAATQIGGGKGNASYTGGNGNFGYAGNGYGNYNNGGGGGGWYGGCGSSYAAGPNSGGSSYISGHVGSISVDNSMYINGGTVSFTGKFFLNTIMIDGRGYKWTNKIENYVGMPTIEDGTVYMTGNAKEGHARITFSNFASMTNADYDKLKADAQNIWEYDYMGYYQQFTSPKSGTYKIELWGAQGGSHNGSYVGGLGAYTSGEITLKSGQTLYIFVGSQGTSSGGAGWNGGGTGTSAAGGGGATDVRTVADSTLTSWNNSSSLLSRIMVAGGGAGSTVHSADSWVSYDGGGGGLTSYVSTGGSGSNPYTGTAATQVEGGKGNASYTGGAGGFGYGGNGYGNYNNGGGGSGWFGGCGSSYAAGPNSGGTSYISGHNGCVGINAEGSLNSSSATSIDDSYSYTGFIFKNTKMIDGRGYSWTDRIGSSVVKMPSHENGLLIRGNTGNGYARITFVK